MIFREYSLHLNEIRKNLAPPGMPHRRAAGRTILVGDLDRSPLIPGYGYASADDQSTLFAIFPLNFVPFMQYAD